MDDFQSFDRVKFAYQQRGTYERFLEPRLRNFLAVAEDVNRDYRMLYCSILEEWLRDGYWDIGLGVWDEALGRYSLTSGSIGGYVFPPSFYREPLSIFVNGKPLDVTWDLPSEMDKHVRPWLRKRWGYRANLDLNDDLNDAEIEFSCGTPDKTLMLPWHMNYWYAKPSIPEPSAEHLARISCGNEDPWTHRIMGVSLYKKFDRVCREVLGKSLAEAKGVLDFGCGWGRVMRHCPVPITGMDIDPVNIRWASENNPKDRFIKINLKPPVPAKNHSFEVIYSNAVFNHLREDAQFAWLAELRRLVKPDGLVMITLNSQISWALLGWFEVQNFIEWTLPGFRLGGVNKDIDDVVDSDYVDVTQTHEYIHREYARYFHILKILEGFGGGGLANVVMRPKPS